MLGETVRAAPTRNVAVKVQVLTVTVSEAEQGSNHHHLKRWVAHNTLRGEGIVLYGTETKHTHTHVVSTRRLRRPASLRSVRPSQEKI
jgi:hypothetical protein